MKRKERSNLSALSYHVADDKLLAGYPELSEFLRAATFEGEDGRREAPTLTLWASAGEWKLAVKDRAENLVMWLSGPTLLDVLQTAECFVGSSEGPWRHDETGHERNGKRVKK
jgi:hypothetical protein